MARHQISAAKPKPEKPRAEIRAAPSSYETTHPVGSAERFLDQAAKDALAAAAAGGVPPLSRFIPGAVRAVAKEAEKYPDPLLSEAAGLPAAELAKRAARAEAYRQAMEAQNGAVRAAAAVMSPVGNMAANQVAAGADDVLSRREAAKGGDTRKTRAGTNAGHAGDGPSYWEVLKEVVFGPERPKRPDGTLRGPGWIPGGKDSEYSVYADVDGRRVLIPTVTPNMDDGDRMAMFDYVIPGGHEVPERILEKAKAFAKARMSIGLSPFATQEDQDALWQSRYAGFKESHPETYDKLRSQYIVWDDSIRDQDIQLAKADPDVREVRRDALLNGRLRDPGLLDIRSRRVSQDEPDHGERGIQVAKVDSDRREVRQDAQGGDVSGPEMAVSETPVSEAPQNPGGPRIVINPTTFRNNKDALCVAFNEGFRVWMEANDFQPQSEPTDAQRKFFSDTAYADDEVQLRRTILARIATFDTSVKDPTDDQLSETASFLNAVLESDWCRNDWERNSVAKLARAVEASVGAEPVEPKAEPLEAREPEPLQAKAALGGGETDEEQKRQELAQADDQSNGQDLETESGSGATVHYNEDGSFAGQDNADGSYSTVSEGSGEVVQYGADGSYLGAVTKEGEQKSPLAIEPPQAVGEEASAAGDQAAQEKPGEQQQEKPGEQQQEKPGEQQQEKPGEQQQEKPGEALQEEKKPDRGAYSDIWTGGEEGVGRRLTKREAEWTKARIDSGASVSDSQLALFGLSRNERGQYVNGEGEVHQGFDTQPAAQAASPDAGLDRDRKGRGGRRLGDFGARSLTNTRRMT